MIIHLLMLLSFNLHAAQTDLESEKLEYMCKNGKIVRTLSYNHNKSSGECSTIYTKAGVDRKIGWGQNIDTCKSVLNQVKDTLEKNAWKCRDISSIQVSDD